MRDIDKNKLSYALGMFVYDKVLKNYGDLDHEIFLKALIAQQEGGETKLSKGEAESIIREYEVKAKEKKAASANAVGRKYINDNKTRNGVRVTDSGLLYEGLTVTTGLKPLIEDQVSVHYVGTLIDGQEFGNTVLRGKPEMFTLKEVIPGLAEGLLLMSVGSKYRFVIPSDLAYGDNGTDFIIGPGETLIFNIELLDIRCMRMRSAVYVS